MQSRSQDNSVDSKVQTWLEVCIEEEERLTEWENQFIESLSDQLVFKKGLSPRQLEVLKEIYERVV